MSQATSVATLRPWSLKTETRGHLFRNPHGILQVRIIHGKGIGALRETVHAVLRRTPDVLSFGLAPAELGGWGATVVELAARVQG